LYSEPWPHPLFIALCDRGPPTMDWLVGAPDQVVRMSPLWHLGHNGREIELARMSWVASALGLVAGSAYAMYSYFDSTSPISYLRACCLLDGREKILEKESSSRGMRERKTRKNILTRVSCLSELLLLCLLKCMVSNFGDVRCNCKESDAHRGGVN
jgi:hypothetical protein